MNKFLKFRYLPKINKVASFLCTSLNDENKSHAVGLYGIERRYSCMYLPNPLCLKKIKEGVYKSLPCSSTGGFCFPKQDREIGLNIHQGKQNYYYDSITECAAVANAYLAKKQKQDQIKELQDQISKLL